MAKLQKYELDAIVNTVIQQIKDSKKDSPEQKEYDRLQNLSKTLNKEIDQLRKDFEIRLIEEFTKRSEGLIVGKETYGNNTKVYSPKEPTFYIDERTIEREIIVANISGDVQKTINKLVTKYTK